MPRLNLTKDERDTRREAILDAAMQVFEDAGSLEAVSFRNVAAACGVSYATPYSYFDGKAALVNAMRARAFRWMQATLEKAAETSARQGARPMQRLDAISEAYVQAGVTQPHRYALMFFDTEHMADAHPSIELQAAKRDALDVCTQLITASQVTGELPRHVDALTGAHVFWVAAHGVVSLHVAGQLVMGRTLEQLIPIVIETVRQGLRKLPEDGGVRRDRQKQQVAESSQDSHAA